MRNPGASGDAGERGHGHPAQGDYEPEVNAVRPPLVVGETIKVPTNGDTSLVSFGFSIFAPSNDRPPFDMVAYVYAWNGSEATGPALYTSALTPLPFVVFPLTPSPIFETGGINLEAGQEYVIFINPDNGVYLDYLQTGTGPGYADGSTVTTQGADPSLWTTEAWSVGLPTFEDRTEQPQTNFIATFAAPVPEPATWILALAGFLGLAGAQGLRGRREERLSRASAHPTARAIDPAILQ